MIVLLICLVWLACSACSYLCLRGTFRMHFVGWTTGDRALGIGFSLLGGPITLFIALVFYMVVLTVHTMNAGR